MNDFDRRISEQCDSNLCAVDLETIQVNVGLLCNQQCRHCHLQAGPDRTEVMAWETMQEILRVARELGPSRFDLTGGAPELNPHIRQFIAALREDGHEVQLRTNLTALLDPETTDLPELFRDHHVHLVASMPCYLEENVSAQRGPGVYGRSVEVLRRLNQVGYGLRSELPLDLVYNPGGPFLPPPQSELEEAYRKELRERFGVAFTHLLTITNMPMGRFMAHLRRSGDAEKYARLLRESFNPATVEALMCRHQIEIAWNGMIYDCDFNLALGWPVNHGAPDSVRHFDAEALRRRRIVTGDHCFGCTAGSGSSCGGALA